MTSSTFRCSYIRDVSNPAIIKIWKNQKFSQEINCWGLSLKWNAFITALCIIVEMMCIRFRFSLFSKHVLTGAACFWDMFWLLVSNNCHLLFCYLKGTCPFGFPLLNHHQHVNKVVHSFCSMLLYGLMLNHVKNKVILMHWLYANYILVVIWVVSWIVL